MFKPDTTAVWFYDVTPVSAPRPDQRLAPPRAFTLHPAFPNPFNSTTGISFDLPARSQVSAQVLDVKGTVVATLANGFYGAGYHAVRWDAGGMASGVYFCKVQAGKSNGVVNLALVK